jgi:hypothetical protein
MIRGFRKSAFSATNVDRQYMKQETRLGVLKCLNWQSDATSSQHRLQSLCEIDLQERSNCLTLQVAIKRYKLRSNRG